MKTLSLFAALAALAASVPALSSALPTQDQALQFPQASPPSLVRDQVGLTTVEIEYARPGVKGRKIFGGLLPYGEMWRTGANAATKITFSTDVTFGGQAVPAGTYALFTIPGEKEWTVILNQNTGQWGSYNYDEKNDLLRIKIKPAALTQPIETLSIGLGHIRDDSAHFTIAWEKTLVAVPIQTNLVAQLVPQIEAAMATADENKPYLQAAMFYYEHDLDLAMARDWIEAGLVQQPEAVWIVYRKGLILAKMGDKAGAMDAAKQALVLADKAGGQLGAEYKRLSEALIASLK